MVQARETTGICTQWCDGAQGTGLQWVCMGYFEHCAACSTALGPAAYRLRLHCKIDSVMRITMMHLQCNLHVHDCVLFFLRVWGH